LAGSCRIEDATGWSIKNLVRTVRRYRTDHIRGGGHTCTVADPLPHKLCDAQKQIHQTPGVH